MFLCTFIFLDRYLVGSPQGEITLYYEPHCVYNKNFLEKEQADIVITPVIKQLLPNFTLVSGQEDAVQLAKVLNAKYTSDPPLAQCHVNKKISTQVISFLSLHYRYIVPMRNGDLDAKGFLSSLIQSEGTFESFKVWLISLFTVK